VAEQSDGSRSGLEKIMMFLNKKIKFFDLNQIFLFKSDFIYFIFFCTSQ